VSPPPHEIFVNGYLSPNSIFEKKVDFLAPKLIFE
jgi:hypothetical protein